MEKISDTSLITAGKAAFRLLFTAPDLHTGQLEVTAAALPQLLAGVLTNLHTSTDLPQACCVDYLNALDRQFRHNFTAELGSELFDALVNHQVLPQEFTAPCPDANATYLLTAIRSLLKLLKNIPQLLSADEKSQLLPSALQIFDAIPEPDEQLGARLARYDRFSVSRTFRFLEGRFLATGVETGKPLKKFFGFPSVRAIFKDHFKKFAAGVTNLPLLIHSLPGYGKTSMTISHVLNHPDVVLILPEPEALEREWHRLMTPLSRRPDRKFVVFFDDIDSRNVDWYNFRTHVGGAFLLPPNVMPVLSSNYEFPAGILSRGRRISYPVFDEIRCMEMIEDFLLDFGLRTAPRNLVSLIAADYTEEFGQKKFTELSPRTLMRYLGFYERDQIKRRTMVELAMGPMIQKPDGELFYDFNIELMRTLYGENYIQRLLKERLRNL